MNSDARVAARYAKSLISLALEQNKLEDVKQGMTLVRESCEEHRDLRLLLRNPIVYSDKKFAILSALFTGKIDDLLIKFFRLLCKKGREGVLQEVASEVLREYNILKGIQHSELVTAFPIDASLKGEFENLVRQVAKAEVDLHTSVDEELIGGFVLNIGDKQIDSSVQSGLKRMKQQLIKS
ncbi:ATP synthase F1 subunit delta [Rapidithrix thailandica]|uniref:ATP synthase subunit delta n=1 Tax=Rapidithrix thailandica TaxID=413964 RepID=A0AAW9S2C6_9BACT